MDGQHVEEQVQQAAMQEGRRQQPPPLTLHQNPRQHNTIFSTAPKVVTT